MFDNRAKQEFSYGYLEFVQLFLQAYKSYDKEMSLCNACEDLLVHVSLSTQLHVLIIQGYHFPPTNDN